MENTRKRPGRWILGALSGCVLLLAASISSCIPSPPGPFYYFRVMVNGDASKSATIGWSSVDLPSSDQRLHYDLVDHGTDASKYAFSQPISATNTAYSMNNVFARLENLAPETTYYFVVANSKHVSPRYFFRTAPNRPDVTLSVVAGGDSRNNRAPRQNANRLVAKLRPDIVLFGGDMVDNGFEHEWKQWFEDWQLTIADDGRITPVVMTRGNHEYNNQILVDLFDTPPGVYYGVQLGGSLLRVYTLNTEISIAGSQTRWLEQDLANHRDVIWKFAQYHRPMRPHVSSKPSGDAQYAHWAPLFHQFGMNIVSESDAHTAKITWPVRPDTGPGSEDGFIRDDASGTVYIGEGCWGAPLRKNDAIRGWTRDSGKFNHFNWILVSQSEIELRTVQVDTAANVASNTDESRLRVPAGLRIWTPENGSVVRLAR